MVYGLVCMSKNTQILARITIKIPASVRDKFLLAIGRFLVLSTFLSKSLSRKSFIAQPRDLVRNEPSTTIVKFSILKLFDKNKPQRPGHNNSQKPIGL
jgi:hypothetical protein